MDIHTNKQHKKKNTLNIQEKLDVLKFQILIYFIIKKIFIHHQYGLVILQGINLAVPKSILLNQFRLLIEKNSCAPDTYNR